MKKKTMIWTIAATLATAAAVTMYCLRQRSSDSSQEKNRKKNKHLTPVFARAKEVGGEFTL